MQTIALIDYGSGNLRSAEKALNMAAASLKSGYDVLVTSDPEQIAAADRVVLPGVGAFAACMTALQARPGLIEAMASAVKAKGAPFLGICVGMQLLATRGLEFGEAKGLDWISGDVTRLASAAAVKVPHVGWNDVQGEGVSDLFPGAPAAYYFTHSYAFRPSDPRHLIASVDHGGRFAAAVAFENMAGVQFHPEKSQATGLAFIERFLLWRP